MREDLGFGRSWDPDAAAKKYGFTIPEDLAPLVRGQFALNVMFPPDYEGGKRQIDEMMREVEAMQSSESEHQLQV